jgi:hypothetical protein
MGNHLVEPEHLGGGIVLFRNLVSVDHDLIIPYIAALKEKAVKEDYKIVHDEDGNSLYAINRSGHRYAIEDIYKSSSHIMNFIDNNTDQGIIDFFELCEKTFYESLLKYVTLFPMLLPSLWWRTQGHILAYGPGSAMGLHSDNDVNYQPGFEPDLQLAIRSVVGSIIYFNDSVDTVEDIVKYEYIGGEIEFPYSDVVYKPKSGDLLMFPSNFMAAHNIRHCYNGNRYAYIGYYSQGSAQPERGINITVEEFPVGKQGQIWMPNIVKDYVDYVNEKYSGYNEEKINELLRPTQRSYNSANTLKELTNE